jgi:hypothetical protein
MKSFQKFLESIEISSRLTHMVDAYINNYGSKKNVTDHGLPLKKVLSDCDLVKGQCYTVAHDFVRWAKSNYPESKYQIITGETKNSTTEQPDIHYAVKVDNKYVVDLTYKQFHPEFNGAIITTVSEFHKEFSKVK